jgi:hypothetical protein
VGKRRLAIQWNRSGRVDPGKVSGHSHSPADYAYSREVCGDHYHSDVEASRALGAAVGVMLLNNAPLKP